MFLKRKPTSSLEKGYLFGPGFSSRPSSSTTLLTLRDPKHYRYINFLGIDMNQI